MLSLICSEPLNQGSVPGHELTATSDKTFIQCGTQSQQQLFRTAVSIQANGGVCLLVRVKKKIHSGSFWFCSCSEQTQRTTSRPNRKKQFEQNSKWGLRFSFPPNCISTFKPLLYFTVALPAGEQLPLVSTYFLTVQLPSWWQISPRRINSTINLPI